MRRETGAIDYRSHFILLICVATVLELSGRWRSSLGAVASVGLYGAMHSSMIVVTLRTREALLRKLLFVGMACALSMLSVLAGLAASRLLRLPPGMATPALPLTLASAVGAASYALLVRRFWVDDLSLRAVLSMTLCCVSATLAALIAGTYLHTLSGSWFAIVWWCAFSTALWNHDERCRR